MPGFAVENAKYLDPAQDMDALMGMILELASEVSVLRDRQAVTETLLAGLTGLRREDIDAALPGPELQAELEEAGKAFTSRLIAAACGAGATLP
ncbi:MAG: hypothetical protein ABS910_09895 [Arthrobacter sp.]